MEDGMWKAEKQSNRYINNGRGPAHGKILGFDGKPLA